MFDPRAAGRVGHRRGRTQQPAAATTAPVPMFGTESQGQLDQVSAVPFRRSGDQLEFCLITSIQKGRWGFPKGIIDPGETLVETALKEAREEAGLHGRIVGDPLGYYRYHKWGTDLAVAVVLMEVSQTDGAWDEDDVRDRRWVAVDVAKRMVTKSDLRYFLAVAVERLTSG